MNNINFRYSFDDIAERSGVAEVTDLTTGNVVARSKVAIDDSSLFSSIFPEIPSFVIDLADLALAIHFADRMTPFGRGNSRFITISLPVRDPERLTKSAEKLQEILWWNTRDHWIFNFRPRTMGGRAIEIQKTIRFSEQNDTPTEVALWSGGLDSLVGLLQRANESPLLNYVLVGTGSNSGAFEAQRQAFEKIRHCYPYHTSLVQVPFRWATTDRSKPQNRYSRSRGFVFLLVGSIVAYLQGQSHLFVYENGIGAINLPFNQTAKGIDHSRSVHPKSLFHAADFISGFLDQEFSIENPFLFSTKGEMCSVLSECAPNVVASMLDGVSTCDRRMRNRYHECGWCSSCLLRRQALWSAQISDPTHYYVQHGISGNTLTEKYLRYLTAMDKQVKWMEGILALPNSWDMLYRPYLNALSFVNQYADQKGVSVSEIRSQVIDLYRRHVKEWNKFAPVLEDSWFDSEVVDTVSRISPITTCVQGDLSYAEEYS